MVIRKRIWEIIEVAKPGDTASKVFDFFILALIFLNVVAVILESVEALERRFHLAFEVFELFSVAVFSLEYVARIWSCVSLPQYAKPLTGRLRFIFKPLSIIDLVAVLPFYLSFVSVDLRVIRMLRLLRIFRVAKLTRYSSVMRLFGRVFKDKKEELALTFMLMLGLIILVSSLMYFAEHEAQPDKFPDIPSAMWWSVVTLTTVGYGDIYPVTTLGKVLAGLSAILGVGMFALPTGILGASFVEEIQKQKAGRKCCPHCGGEL
ncbi:MAG: ion transporter [Acidobacteria bacterium]|nr:ion transporter [Acidobacteriota bacterium]